MTVDGPKDKPLYRMAMDSRMKATKDFWEGQPGEHVCASGQGILLIKQPRNLTKR